MNSRPRVAKARLPTTKAPRAEASTTRGLSTAALIAGWGLGGAAQAGFAIGAFGAFAFTIGAYGIASVANLFALIATFYLTSLVFVSGLVATTLTAVSLVLLALSSIVLHSLYRIPRQLG